MVGVSAAVMAGVLWIWSHLTLWIMLIVALTAVFLLRFTPAVAWGVAIGVGCLVCVFHLRTVLPPGAQWTAVGLSVALAVTCGLVRGCPGAPTRRGVRPPNARIMSTESQKCALTRPRLFRVHTGR